MSRLNCFGLIVLLPITFLLLSTSATAQDIDYVDYNDDDAAGTINYNGEAAVGDAGGEVSFGDDDLQTPMFESVAQEELDDREKLEMWQLGASRHHLTLGGSSGLFNIKEAGSAEAGTWGAGVFGRYFKYSDYLVHGDENTNMKGNLSLRVTPLDFLEIHAGISASANYNNKEYPGLFQTMGDWNLGIKGYFSPIDSLTIGLDAGVFFFNTVGDVAVNLSSTSVGFEGLVTFDVTEVNSKIPLRFHAVAGYFFDNTANITNDIELANGGCGSDLDGDGQIEYQGCLSAIERTALEIDRNDQVKLAIGFDFLLPYVSPIFEYKLEIPVNRQDFICPQNIPGEHYDSCMFDEKGSAFRRVITIGARILPPIANLAIDLGVDIGVSGYAPTVHELAAEVPYRFIFGASYSFAAFVEAPKPIQQPEPMPVVIEPLPSEKATIAGFVHDEASANTPISGAVITYVGTDFNSQISRVDGKFNSYGLPAGALDLEIKAKGYYKGSFSVEILETGTIEQSFALKEMPKKGIISVVVVDEKDNPIVDAEVNVEGVINEKFKTNADGRFEFETGKGKLILSTSVDGFLSKKTKTVAKLKTTTQIQIQLRSKPKRSLVIVKAKRLKIKSKIHFEINSDVIDPRSFALLDEITDTLINHTEIRSVEIQGHSDDRGKRDYNIELSERRAQSVKNYLAESGIESNRLTHKGIGSDKPIAPNITRNGRARNRRVEFHILDKQ